jgi:hypothetical protein
MALQMKSFGPKNFKITCRGEKVPFWQFFRNGRDGHALLLSTALKNPSLDFKNSYVLGFYEFLAMLEGKTRKDPFF